MVLDYLAHLRSESARFAEVMGAVDPATPVPSCPDWTAADLVYHLAEVQNFWATIVAERLDDPDSVVDPDRPDDYAELLAVLARAHSELVAALEAAPDDAVVWSWSFDGTVGFVRRRMAQEALVHRVDAELTAGTAGPLDRELAADGVHEAIQHFHAFHPPWAVVTATGPTGSVQLTDTGQRWTFRHSTFSGTSPNTGTTYTDEKFVELVDDGKATFTVSGTAADVEYWIWNRPPHGQVRIEGADAATFEAMVHAGLQ